MLGRATAAGLPIASFLLCCSSIARAAEPANPLADSTAGQTLAVAPVQEVAPPQPETTAGQPASKEEWEFATVGYAWFAGAWGETDIIGPTPPVDLSLPFGKVLKAFKFAFMGAAEARHDRLLFLGDLTFIHLDARHGIGIRDPNFLRAELDSRTAEVTLVGGYRVVNKGPVTVDLLAGGRMNFFKTTLQLDGPNSSAEGSVTKNWLDPLVAARVNAPLGGKWSLAAYGDLGGVIFGSKITWQLAPTINYQISPKMTLGAGWRYYKVNRDKGDFLYNVHQSGPIITFRTIL